jgi:E3 ubiquitin-protein ligase listerin
LALVFPTPEKQLALRKRYQEQVLVFCRIIIDEESAQTLSDERTVSPDEAAAKYGRVVAAALGLIANLIGEYNAEDMHKAGNEYEELIQSKKVWSLATSLDPNVRRALHRYVRSFIQNESTKKMLNLSQISSAYIEKGLESDQKSSASEFLETLTALTHFDPLIWTEHWTSKKPAHVRLRHFLRHGSQSAPQQYWTKIAALLELLPSPALPALPEESEQLLGAFHKGITKKDEPRMYLLPGLLAYVQTIGTISKRLPDEDQKKVLRDSVLPIVRAYIFPSTDLAWTLPNNGASDVVQKALELQGVISVFTTEWVALSEQLVDCINMSLSKDSKDYASSQKSVRDAGIRWTTTLSLVLRSDNSGADYDVQATEVLRQILEVCKSQNGEPYGAISVAAHLVKECRSLFAENSDALSMIETFLLNDLPKVYLSPSLKPLASILGAFGNREVFKAAWTACLKTTLQDSESSRQVAGFKELVNALDSSTYSTILLEDAKVRDFLIARLDHTLNGDDQWDFIAEILAHSKQEPLETEILASMTAALSISSRAQNSLSGFLKLSKTSPHMLQTYVDTVDGRELLSHILRLTENRDDEIAHSALELNERIHSIVAYEIVARDNTRHGIIEVIHAGLTSASPDSVSVETLISQAQTLMKSKSDMTLEPLLPQASLWRKELSEYLTIPPLYALAVTSPLHEAVIAVDQASVVPQLPNASGRDLDGYSVPLRMAVYTTELLKSSPDLFKLDAELLSELLQLLVQTMVLANDNLGLVGCNGLWSPHHPLVETDMIEFVSQSQSLITSWLQGSADWWLDASASSSYSFVNRAIQSLFEDSKGRSATSYYAAHSYYFLIKELIDVHGWPARRSPDVSERLMDLRRSKDLFRTLAYVSSHVDVFSNGPISSRWYNELLADLTGLDISKKGEEALQKLLILNAMVSGQEESIIATAAHQRLVFFVRHVTAWLREESVPATVKTITCAVVSKLLPSLLGLYGDHWEALITWINEFWLKLQLMDMNPYSDTLPLLHSTLRLYTALRRMTLDDECNEDLIETIQSFEKDTFVGLLNILSLERHCPDNLHQPLRIVNELIARVFDQLPFQDLQKPESLYHLMNCKSEAIQLTSYKLLHKQIPLLQAQLSLEIVIDNKIAQLPDELLSLVLDTPKRNELEDTDLDRGIPLPLKGYLLSWMLVFDHFKEAVKFSNIRLVSYRLTFTSPTS